MVVVEASGMRFVVLAEVAVVAELEGVVGVVVAAVEEVAEDVAETAEELVVLALDQLLERASSQIESLPSLLRSARSDLYQEDQLQEVVVDASSQVEGRPVEVHRSLVPVLVDVVVAVVANHLLSHQTNRNREC